MLAKLTKQLMVISKRNLTILRSIISLIKERKLLVKKRDQRISEGIITWLAALVVQFLFSQLRLARAMQKTLDHLEGVTFLSLASLWSEPQWRKSAKFWTETNLAWFKRRYSLRKLSLLYSQSIISNEWTDL